MTEVAHKSTMIYLETSRLILRPFTPNDVDNLLELDADPDVRRFLDRPEAPTREDIAEGTLPYFLAWYERPGGFGYWAAVESSSGAFLGWFHFRPDRHNPQDTELGYRLKRSAWGSGYATEGARALIRKGFLELGVSRVTATALTGNVASIRVMEKISLTFETRFWHKPGLEAVRYALDRADYVR